MNRAKRPLIALLLLSSLWGQGLVRPARAAVTVGIPTVTEYTNRCKTGAFDNGDTLKVATQITNNLGSSEWFHVIIRLRGTSAHGEVVDAAYGGPLYVQESLAAAGFDDSFGLTINTPVLTSGSSYTVVGFLGLHRQFMADVMGFGTGNVSVDVEVYRRGHAGTSGFQGSNTRSITLVNKSNANNCDAGISQLRQNATGILVSDSVIYPTVGSTVHIEWGAMGGDSTTRRPAYSELGPATVEIRRLAGFPSGDPVADFIAAAPVTSCSAWTPHNIVPSACRSDEGVARSFCFAQKVSTVTGQTGHATYTIQQADNRRGLIMRLDPGAGTSSHTIRDAQYNYFFVGQPTAVDLVYFRVGEVDQQDVRLEWAAVESGSTLGFKPYRARVNSLSQADALAFIPSELPGSIGEATYAYTDTVPAGGLWWYWLAEVDTSGGETYYGPVSAQVPDRPAIHRLYLPWMAHDAQ
jgi:hypothetical protein